jgi:plastocyanin
LSFTPAARRGHDEHMMNLNPQRHERVLTLMLLTGLAASISACGDDTSPATGGLNGCAEANFIDRTAAAADRTVSFGTGANAFSYGPKCLTVAAGQTVTFMGDLAVHPLAPGTSPSAVDAGTTGNPIPRTSTGAMVRVTFASAGTFPYFCEFHYAGGMVGVVRVR